MGRFAQRGLGRRAPLTLERLEPRTLLDASVSLQGGGSLVIATGADRERVQISLDPVPAQLVIQDNGHEIARVSNAAATDIVIQAGSGDDLVRIDPDVMQPSTFLGGSGQDYFYAGGGPSQLTAGTGPAKLIGGPNNDVLVGGTGPTFLDGRGGANQLVAGPGPTTLSAGPQYSVTGASAADTLLSTAPPPPVAPEILLAQEVNVLLERAAAASDRNDAIIVVVDRNGTILGVRVESGVSPAITDNTETTTFAIDGAVSLARTGAYFANNQAPLTSRTVQFISQSSITEREVDSDPNITDPNSPLAGPGFVAPIGVKGHFPPGIDFTPQVDLQDIEFTNRDGLVQDAVVLPERFNADPAYVPAGQQLQAPDSYGEAIMTPAELADPSLAKPQSRGIATLPGGIPIYKNGQLVGGIGVFFPGTTGYASEENSALSSDYDPSKPDLSEVAEWMAFAAVGGSSGFAASVGTLAGVAPLPGFDLPAGRIDLQGITLDIFGPGGNQGPANLLAFGQQQGTGDPLDGADLPVDAANDTLLDGKSVPDGWLVLPHAGVGVSEQDVVNLINQGIATADQTRAAIRLPDGSSTRMVFAVADETGAVLGLYRMPDATVFSIDVAVAKARNVAYYDNAAELQTADEVPGVAPGTALTARTFRYLAQPRFPEGIDGSAPGPFSILNDGGASLTTGLDTGAPLPASAFQSVEGYVAIHPQANFHDPNDPLNQNGVVFFPGSMPLYTGGAQLVGGLGVSGDGVDEDDVVTFGASQGYQPPPSVTRADDVLVRGVRLPFQKFDRNPFDA